MGNKSEPIWQWVPYELRDLVCTCDGPRAHIYHPRDLQLACADCKKYLRYTVVICKGCGNKYIQAFDHVNRCFHNPHCWHCLEAADKPFCDPNDDPERHESCKRRAHTAMRNPQILIMREAPSAEEVSAPLELDLDF